MTHPIKPSLETEVFAENLRRHARQMSREELLQAIDSLSRLYCQAKAGSAWLAMEAARNLGKSS